MGNVDTTKREVEAHEEKGNPHGDSASTADLADHEQQGNPHGDSASTADLADHEQQDNPHGDSASTAEVPSIEEIREQALAAEIVLGGL